MKEQTRVKAMRLRQEAPRTDVLKPVAASRPAEWIDASQKKDGFSRLLRADRLIRNLAAAAGLMLVAVVLLFEALGAQLRLLADPGHAQE